MKIIEVGQLWLDNNKAWLGDSYTEEMLYVVCSREPDEPWICMCFQEWKMGSFEREFSSTELNKLKFVGNLSDIKDTERLNFELSHTTEWQGFMGSRDKGSYEELQVFFGHGHNNPIFEAPTRRECLDMAILYVKEFEGGD